MIYFMHQKTRMQPFQLTLFISYWLRLASFVGWKRRSRGLILVCGPTGNSFEDFELQAEAFEDETGFMRPGKDMPAAMGGSYTDDVRREVYSSWVAKKVTVARAIIAELDQGKEPK